MRHVAKDEQLQLASRGDRLAIATFPGEKLDHEYDLCRNRYLPCRTPGKSFPLSITRGGYFLVLLPFLWMIL